MVQTNWCWILLFISLPAMWNRLNGWIGGKMVELDYLVALPLGVKRWATEVIQVRSPYNSGVKLPGCITNSDQMPRYGFCCILEECNKGCKLWQVLCTWVVPPFRWQPSNMLSLFYRVSLFVVDCVEREECQDLWGHLEDAKDDVGCASFLCFFLGLLYRHF